MTPPARTLGFSLIEMLAALAILSIAGVALLNALTTSTRAAALAQDAALAQIAAENILSERLLDALPDAPIQEARGDYTLAARGFEWRIEVDAADASGLARVTLHLSDAETGTELYALTTFRRTRT